MKSKLGIAALSTLLLFSIMQSANAASADTSICKKASAASIATSDQTLYPSDSLVVTFKGVGGGCQSGRFKVIVSNSSSTNSLGYISGLTTNVSLDANPTGAENNFQRVTHTRQISTSEVGKYLQYYFVTSSGVRVRSVVLAVSAEPVLDNN